MLFLYAHHYINTVTAGITNVTGNEAIGVICIHSTFLLMDASLQMLDLKRGCSCHLHIYSHLLALIVFSCENLVTEYKTPHDKVINESVCTS